MTSDFSSKTGENPHDDLIHDWNTLAGDSCPENAIEFDDESLRDGLQSPSVTDPPIEKKSCTVPL